MSSSSDAPPPAPPGASDLMGLFAPPSPEPTSSEGDTPRSGTAETLRHTNSETGSSSHLERLFAAHLARDEVENNEQTPLLSEATPASAALSSFLDSPPASYPPHNELQVHNNNNNKTPKIGSAFGRKTAERPSLKVDLPSIREIPVKLPDDTPRTSRRPLLNVEALVHRAKSTMRYAARETTKSTTWIGAFMFLLYQIVFCLTMGSAITRPHSSTSLLGLMTKMAALGIMLGAPVFWLTLADDMPALYPTVDLFSAPFLANIAAIVDETLYQDASVDEHDNDETFLATFSLLACVALLVSGTLLLLSSVFKLANLGSFLPSAVLSGFFAAVGVLTWTLAVKVDTGGKTVHQIVFSGDSSVVLNAIGHHLPSVAIASAMKYLGPKHPFYVVALVLGTIALFYAAMFVLDIPMEQMIERGWFWSQQDLLYQKQESNIGFARWSTPAPLGWINTLVQGRVHWGAFCAGLETTLALAFLYMIRCSLHAAALRKSVPNLKRQVKAFAEVPPPPRESPSKATRHRRLFSEVIDIEHALPLASLTQVTKFESPKQTRHGLKEILTNYGISQFVCATVGSFAITPSVAASPIMYTLGAENVAPQLGSVLFLAIFFLTNFELVSLIPKPAFSSLLVLAFIDMIANWFIRSYFRTKEKIEWLVVPLIVVMAFVVGLLSAVFLGIAMSTFFFVGSFFKSGVVKYVANGITIRSTIERPLNTAKWLDMNGEFIQVLVLQNYLFFGNASSIHTYIMSMFEEPSGEVDELFLPPIPRVVVLDLSLVSGMDGSAVDVMADILAVCGSHNCKVFLSGISTSIRQTMALGGVKPETGRDRKSRMLRFFPDLDSAIGKAEDYLLAQEAFEDELYPCDYRVPHSTDFQHALWLIDQQHETSCAEHLVDLEPYTKVVQLEPGEILYEDHQLDRGLFFIEEGIMKIERVSDYTLSRAGSTNTLGGRLGYNTGSLNQLKARSGTIGRELIKMKASRADQTIETFRVARIGPGWVLGSIEALIGLENPGPTIAVNACKLHYISFKDLDEIEKSNPVLSLKLYKLLSMLLAKRQELTISHLATLHSIMSSPARKPCSRNETQKFRSTLHGL